MILTLFHQYLVRLYWLSLSDRSTSAQSVYPTGYKRRHHRVRTHSFQASWILTSGGSIIWITVFFVSTIIFGSHLDSKRLQCQAVLHNRIITLSIGILSEEGIHSFDFKFRDPRFISNCRNILGPESTYFICTIGTTSSTNSQNNPSCDLELTRIGCQKRD